MAVPSFITNSLSFAWPDDSPVLDGDEAAADLRAARDIARRGDILRIDLPDTAAPAGQFLCELAQGDRVWTIAGPERIALTGPNGSGKTAIMETIPGLRQAPGVEVRRRIDGIGYVPQRMSF